MCELLHRSREIEAPHLGTIGTVARGINDLGEIVGYFANANGTHASSPAVPCSRSLRTRLRPWAPSLRVSTPPARSSAITVTPAATTVRHEPRDRRGSFRPGLGSCRTNTRVGQGQARQHKQSMPLILLLDNSQMPSLAIYFIIRRPSRQLCISDANSTDITAGVVCTARANVQEQFSESKSPPTGGSHLPHAHPGSFEMRRTVPVPTRGAGGGRQSALISPEVAEPVG